MLLGGVEFTNLERVSKELPEGMVDQIVLNLALNSTCRVSTSTCFIGYVIRTGIFIFASGWCLLWRSQITAVLLACCAVASRYCLYTIFCW